MSNLSWKFSNGFKAVDSANNHFTILFELKSPQYPHALKIEIRKEKRNIKTEASIAFSPHAQVQVLVKTVALEDMMKSKIEAFLDRKEIRDAYDIEFMLKRGIALDAENEILDKLLAGLARLGKKDFSVKLGLFSPAVVRGLVRFDHVLLQLDAESFQRITIRIVGHGE